MTRRQERRELNQPVNLHDCINGGQFGELVNITSDGFMALTDCEHSPRSIYQLELKLPIALEGQHSLQLGADCLWCRPAGSPGRFWCGFYIIDISERALKQLEQLILLYGKDEEE